jgi:hypothetical protein
VGFVSDHFDDLEDFERMLSLVHDRLVPVVEWIELHEDPDHKAKVRRALFTLIVVAALRDGLATPEEIKVGVDRLSVLLGGGSFDHLDRVFH